eukprot:g33007.t1
MLNGMAADTFSAVLEFIYTGRLNVTEKSIEHIVTTAEILKVNDLIKAYSDYQDNNLHVKVSLASNGIKVVVVDPNVDNDQPSKPKRKRGRPRKCEQLQTERAEVDSGTPTDPQEHASTLEEPTEESHSRTSSKVISEGRQSYKVSEPETCFDADAASQAEETFNPRNIFHGKGLLEFLSLAQARTYLCDNMNP